MWYKTKRLLRFFIAPAILPGSFANSMPPTGSFGIYTEIKSTFYLFNFALVLSLLPSPVFLHIFSQNPHFKTYTGCWFFAIWKMHTNLALVVVGLWYKDTRMNMSITSVSYACTWQDISKNNPGSSEKIQVEIQQRYLKMHCLYSRYSTQASE